MARKPYFGQRQSPGSGALKEDKIRREFPGYRPGFLDLSLEIEGGRSGLVRAGKMVPKFEEACKKLSVGGLSQVVSTQFGHHIIKLTGRR